MGDSAPAVVRGGGVLRADRGGPGTISIAGDDLQPGAQLLVDSRLVEGTGSFQNGRYVFVANWAGNQPPQRLGILNPDGTAAQTTTITLNSSDEHGNGNGNSNGNGNGNGKP